jgi:hypothetical protein
MSVRRELRVDVSDAVGTGERLAVAATASLPDDIAEGPGRPRTVVTRRARKGGCPPESA